MRKWREGDIYAIESRENSFSRFRLLTAPLAEFYGDFSARAEDLELKDPVFKIAIHRSVIRSPKVIKIGYRALSEADRVEERFFKVDPIAKKLYVMWLSGREEISSYSECKHLERASVWEFQHVAERLNDLSIGKTNKWVKLERDTLEEFNKNT